MKRKTIRVGTRGSDLALWQARWVIDRLRDQHPGFRFRLVEVSTKGDQDRHIPLHQAGGVGLFVKALEFSLLDREIDLAVHSLKDMPSRVTDGLALAAVPERADPRDALISTSGACLQTLPAGARIGTGSPRRKAQLLAHRPDLEVAGIRGNVDTRLQKLSGPRYDALVLAAAGLSRLDCQDVITEMLQPETMLPAAGQGSLAVEIRAGDDETRAVLRSINHEESWAAAEAERSFMAHLGAGCHVPAAAYAVAGHGEIWLRGLVASLDGQTIIRAERRDSWDDGRAVGQAVADDLLERGAAPLLEHGA